MCGTTCAASPPLGPAVPRMCDKQDRQTHDAARTPDPGASRTLPSRPRQHRRPFLSRQRIQVPPHHDRPDHPLAGGSANHRHDGRNRPSSILGQLGFAFRSPSTVTSDRGAQFTSGTWQQSLTRLGIATSTTSAYHPQANGIVECFHRTLKNGLCCATRTNLSWTRSLPWAMLVLRNAPRTDTATSTAEIVFGTPLRIPGLCVQDEQSRPRSVAAQLELARTNTESFSPRSLDLRKFKHTPFVSKTLRTAQFVYVRDDRLGKPSLAPKYNGPFRVKEKTGTTTCL